MTVAIPIEKMLFNIYTFPGETDSFQYDDIYSFTVEILKTGLSNNIL